MPLDAGLLAVLLEDYAEKTQLAEGLGLCELIDEHGTALYADFRRFYGLDLAVEIDRTWPRLLLALVEALPEDSALVASLRGGGDWRGWTLMHSILADIYDAVNANTRATGQWKKSPPKIPPWPRPKAKRKPTTVADIRRRFAGR